MNLPESIPSGFKSPITTADEVPFRRFLERMVGHGFALTVVLGERQNGFEEIVGWLETESERLQAQVHKINLSRLTFNNPWLELDHLIGKKPSTEKNILLLHSVDPRSELSQASEVRLFRQLNVQRDSLTRDYPCFWVLLIPPRLEHQLKTQAPDFCDFVGYWSSMTPGEAQPEQTRSSFTTTSSPAPNLSGTPESDARLLAALGNELLFGALKATWEWRLDEARGILARYELASRQNANPGALAFVEGYLKFHEGDKPAAAELFAIADNKIDEQTQGQLKAELLIALGDHQRSVGQPEKAMAYYKTAHALADRLGDVREKAVAMGQIADILQQRGQSDEALRIRREEQIPVYDRLGDVHSKAVTMGQIAAILQQRGQTDEALRVLRDQVPVFDGLGDVRSKAVTMGRIADILQQRGQSDEALRIRRDEELPVYDRLGDVREKAVAMGKIAAILRLRGQTDEALRVLRDQVPVFDGLGDVRSKAVTMGRIADILQQRGQTDEALRIRRKEQIPVYEQLGDVRESIVVRANLGITLLNRSTSTPAEREEAKDHLRWALEEAEKRQYREADQIRDIVKQWIPDDEILTSPSG
ncbi:MAG: tetratricopeptide repeat protein [Fimbriiglobus sp.]